MIQVGLILLLAVTIVAIIRRPAVAFGFVMVLMPTEQLLQTTFSVFGSYPTLGNFVLAFITGLGVVSAVARGEYDFRSCLNLAQVLTIVYYMWLCATSLWAPEPLVAFDSLRIGIPYALLLVVIAPSVIRNLSDFRVAMITTLLYGTAVAGLIIINPNFELSAARLGASLDATERTNPLELGSLGGKLMLVGALSGPFVTGWWSLPVRGLACVLGAGLAVLSGTRGQTIFGMLFSFIFFPITRRIENFKTFIGTAVGLTVVVVGLVAGGSMFVGLDNRDRWSEESLLYGGAGRLENAIDLLSAYLSSPGQWLTGLGYQAFWSLPTRSGDVYSHVATADALAEAGLIGFALYATIIFIGTRAVLRVFSASSHDRFDRAAAGLIGAFLGYSFLVANKQGTAWSSYYIYMFAIIAYRCEMQLASARATETAALDGSYEDAEYVEDDRHGRRPEHDEQALAQ